MKISQLPLSSRRKALWLLSSQLGLGLSKKQRRVSLALTRAYETGSHFERSYWEKKFSTIAASYTSHRYHGEEDDEGAISWACYWICMAAALPETVAYFALVQERIEAARVLIHYSGNQKFLAAFEKDAPTPENFSFTLGSSEWSVAVACSNLHTLPALLGYHEDRSIRMIRTMINLADEMHDTEGSLALRIEYADRAEEALSTINRSDCDTYIAAQIGYELVKANFALQRKDLSSLRDYLEDVYRSASGIRAWVVAEQIERFLRTLNEGGLAALAVMNPEEVPASTPARTYHIMHELPLDYLEG